MTPWRGSRRHAAAIAGVEPPPRHPRARQARARHRHDGARSPTRGPRSAIVLIDGLKFEIKPEDRARTRHGPVARNCGAGGETGGRPGPATRVGPGGGPGERTTSRRGRGPPRPATQQPGRPDARSHRPTGPNDRDRSGDSHNGSRACPSQSQTATRRRVDKLEAQSRSPRRRETNEREGHRKKPRHPPLPRCRRRDPSRARPRATRPRTAGSKPEPKKQSQPRQPAAPFVDVAIELDEDRKPALQTGGDVLIKDATILTVTKGTIAKGSILVEEGKIKAVGADVTAPPGVTVIDAAGMVAMPGIIDTHSHIAVQGGVNEGSLSIVPEVRVKDVVTGDDVGDLPGAGRRHHHRSAAARLGQHDRRPGRGDQAQVRQARPRPDHPRRAAGREVRPGRERHPARTRHGSPTPGWASSR